MRMRNVFYISLQQIAQLSTLPKKKLCSSHKDSYSDAQTTKIGASGGGDDHGLGRRHRAAAVLRRILDDDDDDDIHLNFFMNAKSGWAKMEGGRSIDLLLYIYTAGNNHHTRIPPHQNTTTHHGV